MASVFQNQQNAFVGGSNYEVEAKGDSKEATSVQSPLIAVDQQQLFSEDVEAYATETLKCGEMEKGASDKLSFTSFNPELTSRLIDVDSKILKQFRFDSEVKQSISKELDLLQPSSKLDALLQYSSKILEQSKEAYNKETEQNVENSKKVEKSIRLQNESKTKPISNNSKLGLKCLVDVTLTMKKALTIERGSRDGKQDILLMLYESISSTLNELPPLSLQPGTIEGLETEIRPVIKMLHSTILSPKTSQKERAKALEICLGFGLAQGSLEQLLGVVTSALLHTATSGTPLLFPNHSKLIQNLESHKNDFGNRKILPRGRKPEDLEKEFEEDPIFDYDKEARKTGSNSALSAGAKALAALANLSSTAVEINKGGGARRKGGGRGGTPVESNLLFELDGSCEMTETEWIAKGNEAGYKWNARVNGLREGFKFKSSNKGFPYLRFGYPTSTHGLLWDSRIEPPCTIFLVDRYYKPENGGAQMGNSLQSRDNAWSFGRRYAQLAVYCAGESVGRCKTSVGKWSMQAVTIDKVQKQYKWYLDGKMHALSTPFRFMSPGRLAIGKGAKSQFEWSTLDVGSIVAYDDVLSESSIKKVFDYLSRKYSIICEGTAAISQPLGGVDGIDLVMFKPLALEVVPQTLEHCVSILTCVEASYLGRKPFAAEYFRQLMAIGRDTLTILKTHLLQYSRTMMTPDAHHIRDDVITKAGNLLISLLIAEPSSSKISLHVKNAIRGGAGSALIDGYGFLFPQIPKQIMVLKDLVLREEKNSSSSTSTKYNLDLKVVIERLFARYTKFSTCVQVLNEIEEAATRNKNGTEDNTPKKAFEEFLEIMLNSSVDITVDELKKAKFGADATANGGAQPTLEALCSMQAHITARMTKACAAADAANKLSEDLPGTLLCLMTDKPRSFTKNDSEPIEMKFEERLNPKKFTVDFWMKSNGTGAYSLISNGSSTAGGFVMTSSNNYIVAVLFKDGGQVNLQALDQCKVNVWTRVTFIYDGECAEIFLDLKSSNKINMSDFKANSTTTLKIGAKNSCVMYNFKMMSEVLNKLQLECHAGNDCRTYLDNLEKKLQDEERMAKKKSELEGGKITRVTLEDQRDHSELTIEHLKDKKIMSLFLGSGGYGTTKDNKDDNAVAVIPILKSVSYDLKTRMLVFKGEGFSSNDKKEGKEGEKLATTCDIPIVDSVKLEESKVLDTIQSLAYMSKPASSGSVNFTLPTEKQVIAALKEAKKKRATDHKSTTTKQCGENGMPPLAPTKLTKSKKIGMLKKLDMSGESSSATSTSSATNGDRSSPSFSAVTTPRSRKRGSNVSKLMELYSKPNEGKEKKSQLPMKGKSKQKTNMKGNAKIDTESNEIKAEDKKNSSCIHEEMSSKTTKEKKEEIEVEQKESDGNATGDDDGNTARSSTVSSNMSKEEMEAKERKRIEELIERRFKIASDAYKNRLAANRAKTKAVNDLYIQLLSKYAVIVLDASNRILLTYCTKISSAVIASKTKATPEAAGAAELELRPFLISMAKTLHNSIVSKIYPPLLSNLTSLADPNFANITAIFLAPLLTLVDTHQKLAVDFSIYHFKLELRDSNLSNDKKDQKQRDRDSELKQMKWICHYLPSLCTSTCSRIAQSLVRSIPKHGIENKGEEKWMETPMFRGGLVSDDGDNSGDSENKTAAEDGPHNKRESYDLSKSEETKLIARIMKCGIEGKNSTDTNMKELWADIKQRAGKRSRVQKSIQKQADECTVGIFCVITKHVHLLKAVTEILDEGDLENSNQKVMGLLADYYRTASTVGNIMRVMKGQAGDVGVFHANTMKRIRFFLELEPAPSVSPAKGIYQDLLPNMKTKLRRRSSVGLSIPQHAPQIRRTRSVLKPKSKWRKAKIILTLLRTAFKAVSRLKRLMLLSRMRGNFDNEETKGKISEDKRLVSDLMKIINMSDNRFKVEDMRLALDKQRERAMLRLQGLKVFNRLSETVINYHSKLSDMLSVAVKEYLGSDTNVTDNKNAAASPREQKTCKERQQTDLHAKAKKIVADRSGIPTVISALSKSFGSNTMVKDGVVDLKVNESSSLFPDHYLSDVETVGLSLWKQLGEEYYGVVRKLVNIKHDKLDPNTTLSAIQMCNMDLRTEDLQHINDVGIIPFITPLIKYPIIDALPLRKLLLDRKVNDKISDESAANDLFKCLSSSLVTVDAEALKVRYAAWTLFRYIAYLGADYPILSHVMLDNVKEQLSLLAKLISFQTLPISLKKEIKENHILLEKQWTRQVEKKKIAEKASKALAHKLERPFFCFNFSSQQSSRDLPEYCSWYGEKGDGNVPTPNVELGALRGDEGGLEIPKSFLLAFTNPLKTDKLLSDYSVVLDLKVDKLSKDAKNGIPLFAAKTGKKSTQVFITSNGIVGFEARSSEAKEGKEDIGRVKPNEWQRIVIVVKASSTKISTYVNGKKSSEKVSHVISPTSSYTIANESFGVFPCFPRVPEDVHRFLYGVKIITRSLSDGEVTEMAGLPTEMKVRHNHKYQMAVKALFRILQQPHKAKNFLKLDLKASVFDEEGMKDVLDMEELVEGYCVAQKIAQDKFVEKIYMDDWSELFIWSASVSDIKLVDTIPSLSAVVKYYQQRTAQAIKIKVNVAKDGSDHTLTIYGDTKVDDILRMLEEEEKVNTKNMELVLNPMSQISQSSSSSASSSISSYVILEGTQTVKELNLTDSSSVTLIESKRQMVASRRFWASFDRFAHLQDASMNWYRVSSLERELRNSEKSWVPSSAEISIYLAQMMWLTLRISKCREISERVRNADWMNILLTLALKRPVNPTPESVEPSLLTSGILAAKMLQLHLPYIHPTNPGLNLNGEDILKMIFEKVVGFMFPCSNRESGDEKKGEKGWNKKRKPSQHVWEAYDRVFSKYCLSGFAMCWELVHVYRKLLSGGSKLVQDEWRELCDIRLFDALSGLRDPEVHKALEGGTQSVNDDDNNYNGREQKDAKIVNKIRDIACALLILGGETEPIREGARVAVEGESERGTIIEVVSQAEESFYKKNGLQIKLQNDENKHSDIKTTGGGRIVKLTVLLDGDTTVCLTGEDIAKVTCFSDSNLAFQSISRSDEIANLLGSFISVTVSTPFGSRLKRMCLNALRNFLKRPQMCRIFSNLGYAKRLAQFSLGLSPSVAKMPLSVENLESRLFTIDSYDRGAAFTCEPTRQGVSGVVSSGFFPQGSLSLHSYGKLNTNEGPSNNAGLFEKFPQHAEVKYACGLTIFSMILTTDGTLYAYGRNQYGCLGIGRDPSSSIPKPIKTSVKFSQVATGQAHAIAVSVDGKTYGWGDNYYGQLGTGDSVEHQQPLLLTYYSSKKVSVIGCGTDHTHIVVPGEGVYSHGQNPAGQLGIGTTGSSQNYNPQLMKGDIADVEVVQIVGISNAGLAISKNGELYSWGSGPGKMSPNANICEITDAKGPWIQVACANNDVCVVNTIGEVWMFGQTNNLLCQLPVQKWGRIPLPQDAKCNYLAMCYTHVVASCDGNKLYSWGTEGSFSILDSKTDNTYRVINTPRELKFDEKVFSLCCFENHTFVLTGISRVRPPTPYVYDKSAGYSAVAGGSEEEPPLPPYPLSAYLLGEGKIVTKDVDDGLVEFNIYSHADRDMVDASQNTSSSVFGAKTSHKFFAFVNPVSGTERINIITKPCPGEKEGKQYYSLCIDSPDAKNGWQMSPDSVNHFFAYQEKLEETVKFVAVSRKSAPNCVKVRKASSIEKDIDKYDILLSFYAYTDASQFNAKVVLDEIGETHAKLSLFTSIDEKMGALVMADSNILTCSAKPLFQKINTDKQNQILVGGKEKREVRKFAFTLSLMLNGNGKSLSAKKLLSFPGFSMGFADQSLLIGEYDGNDSETKKFPLKEETEKKENDDDDEKEDTTADKWIRITIVCDMANISNNEDKKTSNGNDDGPNDDVLQITVFVDHSKTATVTIPKEACLKRFGDEKSCIELVDGFTGLIKQVAMWEFALSEEHVRCLLAHGLSNIRSDFKVAREEVETLKTFDFTEEQKYMFNNKENGGMIVVDGQSSWLSAQTLVEAAAANTGNEQKMALGKKLIGKALKLGEGSVLRLKHTIRNDKKSASSRLEPLSKYLIVADVFLPKCKEPYTLFDCTGQDELKPEVSSSFRGLSSTKGGFPSCGVRWAQTRSPIPGTPSTFECWLLLPKNASTAMPTLGTLAGNKYMSWFIQNNGNVCVTWSSDLGITSKKFGTVNVRTGLWVHVAVVIDMKLKTVTLYIDGQVAEKAKKFVNLPTNFSEEKAFIGNDTLEPTTCFSGKLRDVRMWAVARSPKEVQESMEGGKISGNEKGLICWYKLNESGPFNTGVVEKLAKKAAGAGPSSDGVVGDDDMDFSHPHLQPLLDMGYDEMLAMWALEETGYESVDEAIGFLADEDEVSMPEEFKEAYNQAKGGGHAGAEDKDEDEDDDDDDDEGEDEEEDAKEGNVDSMGKGDSDEEKKITGPLSSTSAAATAAAEGPKGEVAEVKASELKAVIGKQKRKKKKKIEKSLEEQSKVDIKDSCALGKQGAFVIEAGEDGVDGLISVLPDGKIKILGMPPLSSSGELALDTWSRIHISVDCAIGGGIISFSSDKVEFTSRRLNPMQTYNAGLRRQFTLFDKNARVVQLHSANKTGNKDDGKTGSAENNFRCFAVRAVQVTLPGPAKKMYTDKDKKVVVFDPFQPFIRTVAPSSEIAATLVKMKFPEHWVMKALERNNFQFKDASDYLLSHSKELKIEDRQEDMAIASDTLSKMGIPISVCEKAMRDSALICDADKSVGVITQHAIGKIFSQLDSNNIVEDDKTTPAVLSEAEIEEKKAKRANVVKKQLASILKETKSLQATTLDARLYSSAVASPKPGRVLDFLSLPLSDVDLDGTAELLTKFESSRLALVKTRQSTDKALAVAYSRLCVLLLLKNLKGEELEKLELLTDASSFFLARLLRVVEFTHLPGALNQLQQLLTAKIVDESARIHDFVKEYKAKNHDQEKERKKNQKKRYAYEYISREIFSLHAPVVDQLIQELANQLIVILRLPTYDASKDEKAEENILEGRKRNIGVCLWILQLFLDLFDQAVKLRKHSHVLILRPFVFSSQVVNLLLETVVLCKGDSRLSFLRLLGNLVNSNTAEELKHLPPVKFKMDNAEILMELMDQIHEAEEEKDSGTPSEFSRSLLALNQALIRMNEDIEKREEPDEAKRKAKIKKERKESIKKKIENKFVVVSGSRSSNKKGSCEYFDSKAKAEKEVKALVAPLYGVVFNEGKIVYKSEGIPLSLEPHITKKYEGWKEMVITERYTKKYIEAKFSTEHKSPNLVIENNGNTVKSLQYGSGYSIPVGNCEILTGTACWEVSNINKKDNNTMYMMVGVIPSSKLSVLKSSGEIGSSMAQGWALFTANSCNGYRNNATFPIKMKLNQLGQSDYTIGIEMDCTKRRLSFYKGGLGGQLMYEFKDVKPPVIPAVTLYYGDVMISPIEVDSSDFKPETKYPEWFLNVLKADDCVRALSDPLKKKQMPETFVKKVFSRFAKASGTRMSSGNGGGKSGSTILLSLNKKATQSSTKLIKIDGSGGVTTYSDEEDSKSSSRDSSVVALSADLALDGHIDQKCDFTIACTKKENNPWWELDLGKSYVISRVFAWMPPIPKNNEERKGDSDQGNENRLNEEKAAITFPLHILCSEKPFPQSGNLTAVVQNASIAKKFERFSKDDAIVEYQNDVDPSEFYLIDFHSPVGIVAGKSFAVDMSYFSKKYNPGDYLVMHKTEEKPSKAQLSHKVVTQDDINDGLWFEGKNVPSSTDSEYQFSYMTKKNKKISSSPSFSVARLRVSGETSKDIGPVGMKGAGGTHFDDRSIRPVTKLRVFSNETAIYGIQLWYGGVPCSFRGMQQGKESIVELAIGEYINYAKLEGNFSTVQAIEIKTNRGLHKRFGVSSLVNNTDYKETDADMPNDWMLCSAKGTHHQSYFYNLQFTFRARDSMLPADVPIATKFTKYGLHREDIDRRDATVVKIALQTPVYKDNRDSVVSAIKGDWPHAKSHLTRPQFVAIPEKRPKDDRFSFSGYLNPIYVYLLFAKGVSLPKWAVEQGFQPSKTEIDITTQMIVKMKESKKSGADGKKNNDEGKEQKQDQEEERVESSIKEYSLFFAGPFPSGYTINLEGPQVPSEGDDKESSDDEKKNAEEKEQKEKKKGKLRKWKDAYFVMLAPANVADDIPTSLSLKGPNRNGGSNRLGDKNNNVGKGGIVEISSKGLKGRASGSNGLTFEISVLFPDGLSNDNGKMMKRATLFTSNDGNWSVQLDSNGRVLYTYPVVGVSANTSTGTTTTNNNNNTLELGSFAFDAGKWVHIAISFIKNRAKLYRNGRLIGETKLSDPRPNDWDCDSFIIGGIEMKPDDDEEEKEKEEEEKKKGSKKKKKKKKKKKGKKKKKKKKKKIPNCFASELRIWNVERKVEEIKSFQNIRLSNIDPKMAADMKKNKLLQVYCPLTKLAVTDSSIAQIQTTSKILVIGEEDEKANCEEEGKTKANIGIFGSSSSFTVSKKAREGTLVVSNNQTDKSIRYVRIQAEGEGKQLRIPQVQVYGYWKAAARDDFQTQTKSPPIIVPMPSFKILHRIFTRGAISSIVALINRWSNEEVRSPVNCGSEEIKLNVDSLKSSQHIQKLGFKKSHFTFAVAMLQEFNLSVINLLNYVDLSLPRSYSQLTDNVRDVRSYIFWHHKKEMWNKVLESSKKGKANVSVQLDFIGAKAVFAKRKTDHKARRTLFGQCFQQLKNKNPDMFKVGTNVRAFRANYVGMGSIDAGGPYRDALENMCKELQSPALPLFMKCPNGRLELGENRNTYVPRPSSTSSFHLQLYKFVGKLFGLAMRSKSLLSLDLPSIVWKPLVSDIVTDSDVQAIDRVSWKTSEAIREHEEKVENKKMDVSIFDSTMRQFNFTVPGSDGKMKELIPNGGNVSLQWSNRRLYTEKLREFRLHEFDEHVKAMRSGLSEVVPITYLSVFTWRELESQIAGYGMTDKQIDLLEKMTDYEGGKKDEPHIKFFWKMMRERFNNEQRVKFLVFVWGRSRLPVTAADFEKKFTIQSHHGSAANPDAFFPIAHTCFFSIELPKYTSLDIMTKKVLWAMNNCTSIDADGGPMGGRPVGNTESDDELETLFD